MGGGSMGLGKHEGGLPADKRLAGSQHGKGGILKKGPGRGSLGALGQPNTIS